MWPIYWETSNKVPRRQTQLGKQGTRRSNPKRRKAADRASSASHTSLNSVKSQIRVWFYRKSFLHQQWKRKPGVNCSHHTVSKGWERVSAAKEITKQGVCGEGNNTPMVKTALDLLR